jgi:uncharacterized protein YprB with RNaseH-like and TPR domain/predicted nuclease with RNAse H fold/dephospho-CoA kinase
MLKSTFQHLKGVGEKTERTLWSKGITTWESYAASFQKQLSLFSGFSENTPISESIAAYEDGDIAFFAKTLPTSEYYRVALEFPEDVIFLDIETTGLSLYYDIITIVGWSLGNEYGVYINGQDETRLRAALAQAKAIVTFNGTMFDLKFMNKHFEGLTIPPVHLDLRFFAKRVDLSGGQKAIEKGIGFERNSDIEGMLGEAAPILWHKYRRGDQDAMTRLIEYNHADIEGMKWILDISTELYFKKEAIPKKIQKKPNFSKLVSKINWTKRKPTKSTSNGIFIPKFTGSNKPLITYDQLTKIHSLEDFCAIGIDLVSSEDRETGFCVLKGHQATTCRVKTDKDLIRLAIEAGADLISIDSPLSIPKGRTTFFDDDPRRDEFGITRECERLLKRRGISSYPCLIPSMQKLTQRGMQLAQKFRKLGIPVIESYPGAAQDIMAIPRKQAGLDYLVDGLKEFGLTGEFIHSPVSHDELDAITSAVVGHFFWVGMYEGLGNQDEEYLIIPDLNANFRGWLTRKVIGVSGPIAAGKTTVAEHLAGQGYAYARYSQVLSDMLSKEGQRSSRSTLQELGREVHDEKGQRWLGKKLLKPIIEKNRIVIDGLRFLEDHALMVETFGPSFSHFHIKAPLAVRKKRAETNRSEDLGLDEATKSKTEKEIAQLEKVAHHVIVNDGTRINMIEQLDKLKKKDKRCQ